MTEQELAGLVKKAPVRKAGAAKPTSTQRMQALGRLPKGTLNKTEKRFADYLAMKQIAGEVLWWRFEGLKLMLAPNTSLTIDFNVMMKNGELHMIDVKGSKAMVTDDFRVKAKVAAATFPFAFFTAIPRGRTGYEWDIEAI